MLNSISHVSKISTHTLTWSVTCRFSTLALYHANFNSHAHVERDILKQTVMTKQKNFNSHAHVERDGFLRSFATDYEISTHTLTWSVTGLLRATSTQS